MRIAIRLAITGLFLAPAATVMAFESPGLGGSTNASPALSDPPLLVGPTRADPIPEPAAIGPIAGAIIVALRRRRARPL